MGLGEVIRINLASCSEDIRRSFYTLCNKQGFIYVAGDRYRLIGEDIEVPILGLGYLVFEPASSSAITKPPGEGGRSALRIRPKANDVPLLVQQYLQNPVEREARSARNVQQNVEKRAEQATASKPTRPREDTIFRSEAEAQLARQQADWKRKLASAEQVSKLDTKTVPDLEEDIWRVLFLIDDPQAEFFVCFNCSRISIGTPCRADDCRRPCNAGINKVRNAGVGRYGAFFV